MPTNCTRCEGTGFLNVNQYTEITGIDFYELADPHATILEWMKGDFWDHDVQVCDCCGDGEDWYGTPGEHYNESDPYGSGGPYAYNGGLCECH
ncbi:MAG: hypothetical protein GY841_15965 [FCB group bacterium]|nr:hypothetical protein [FCB group bacterium]